MFIQYRTQIYKYHISIGKIIKEDKSTPGILRDKTMEQKIDVNPPKKTTKITSSVDLNYWLKCLNTAS